MQDEFRLARDNVILEFADELIPVLTIEVLSAIVERRHEQEQVAPPREVVFSKMQKL